MIVTQHPSGIEVSDIIDGYLVTELYIDYTIEEAKAKFLNTHGRDLKYDTVVYEYTIEREGN